MSDTKTVFERELQGSAVLCFINDEQKMKELCVVTKSLRQVIKQFANKHELGYEFMSDRVKDTKGIAEKMIRKSLERAKKGGEFSPIAYQSLRDFPDLAGIRLVVTLDKQVQPMVQMVQRELQGRNMPLPHDELPPLSLEPAEEKNDVFGYRSSHILVHVGDFTIELQIRSLLMHVGAQLSHDTTYKGVAPASDESRKHMQAQLYFLTIVGEDLSKKREEHKELPKPPLMRPRPVSKEQFLLAIQECEILRQMKKSLGSHSIDILEDVTEDAFDILFLAWNKSKLAKLSDNDLRYHLNSCAVDDQLIQFIIAKHERESSPREMLEKWFIILPQLDRAQWVVDQSDGSSSEASEKPNTQDRDFIDNDDDDEEEEEGEEDGDEEAESEDDDDEDDEDEDNEPSTPTRIGAGRKRKIDRQQTGPKKKSR